MKQNQDQEKFNNIEETAKKIFGRDDEDYLADMDMAEQEWNELQERDKEAADQIRREQQKSLLAIQEELRARGSKPMTEEAYEQQQRIEQLEQQLAALKLEKEQAEEQKQEQPQQQEQPTVRETKRRCFSKKKALLMVAAVCVFVVGTAMVAVGNRESMTIVYPLPGEANIVVRQNYPVEIQVDPLMDAYSQVEKKLGIRPLMISYIPDGATFDGLYFFEGSAQIKFSYGEYSFYLHCRKDVVGKNFSDLALSDRQRYHKVFNEWLGQMMVIEKNELERGKVEYSVSIQTETESYYISGIMPEEEFIKIVKGVFFEN